MLGLSRFAALRAAVVLFGVGAIVAHPTAAQELRLSAPRIDDVFSGSDGCIRVQTGSKIIVLAESTVVAADVPAAPTIEIPPDAVVFDHDAALAYVSSDGFFVDGRRVRSAGVLSRAARGTPPVRARLFLGGGLFAATDSRGTTVVHGDRPSDAMAEFPCVVERRSGYGLGAIVDETVTWPHVFLLGRSADAAILAGRRGRYVVRSGTGVVASLPGADLDEGSGIQGFSVDVPPFTADLDGDGVPEFVRTDPGRGVIAVQTGLLNASPPSPQIRLLGGPCLAAGAVPPSVDGPSLYVLKLPALTPARQLAVLMEGRITAQALFYRGAKPGVGTTPDASVNVSLVLKVAVKDGERNGQVLSLVGPTADGKLLVSDPGRPAKLLGRGADASSKELGTLPSGEWLRPLRPLAHGGRLYAVLRTTDGDRLYAF